MPIRRIKISRKELCENYIPIPERYFYYISKSDIAEFLRGKDPPHIYYQSRFKDKRNKHIGTVRLVAEEYKHAIAVSLRRILRET